VEEGSCTAGSDGNEAIIIETVYIMGVSGPISNVTIGTNDLDFDRQGSLMVVKNMTQTITNSFSLQWS